MTIAEVAKLINKSEQSVRRYIKTEKLKAVKVGGVYDIDRKDIPESLYDSQPIDTDSQIIDSDSQAIFIENEYLKQRIDDLEAERNRLRNELQDKEQKHEKRIQELEQARERADMITMQLTRQLEQNQRLLEYKKLPFWRRWFKKSND